MNMMARLHIVYLFVSLFIVGSHCCISLSTGGCSLGRIFFGGRMVITGNDGLGLGGTSQQFIFVTPFGYNSYLKSPPGFGRGQLWVGKRNCLGVGNPPYANCPLDENRPCLDTTVPCFSSPPSYIQAEPLQFSNVTQDSITVTWPAWDETTDLGVGPVSGYKIQYREKGAEFDEKLFGANTLSHRFDGLKVGTTYEFRIVLTRELPSYIESQPTSIQNETTDHGAPPSYSNPEPLQFSSVTEDSITVTWPAWNETSDSGIGPVTQYKIQYREEDGTFSETLLDVQTLSYRFDGLKDGTTYEFRIILMREQSPMEGEPSVAQTQTTIALEPPSYMSDYPLQFSDVTDDSITVTWPMWDKTTDTGKGPVKEYRIQFREKGASSFTEIIIANNTVLSYRFDGLTEGTTYGFRIVLVSELLGTPSRLQNETTLCGDINFSLTTQTSPSKAVGKSRIKVSWSIRTLQGSCVINQQFIEIQQLDNNQCPLSSPAEPQIYSLGQDVRTTTFRNLAANWYYNITLHVVTQSKNYTSSKVQRTAESRPGAPPTEVTHRKILTWDALKWEEPPCDMAHGKIVKYDYVMNRNNQASHSGTTKKKRIFFENLNAESQYTFKVRAWTLSGPGPYSNAVTLNVK